MSKVKVYSRGKYIGIDSNDKGIKDLYPQTIGVTLKVSKDNFEITEEAYNLLLKTQKGGDDLGEIDCFLSDNNETIFGWMGHSLALFDSDFIMGSNYFDFTLIKDFINNEIVIPIEFIQMCDILIQEDLVSGV